MQKMMHLKESLIIPKGMPKASRRKKKKKENLIFWIHADEVTLPDSYERGGWLDE